MTLLVPRVGEVKNLQLYLTSEDLTLKLYSNDKTPAAGDTAVSYTQVSGGGYAAIVLDKDNWTITSADPSYGTYAAQDFSFTGVTAAPGTIYGYYVVDAGGIVRWAERFAPGVAPFTPGNGSLIRVTPRFEAD